jgi:hypothetical protein
MEEKVEARKATSPVFQLVCILISAAIMGWLILSSLRTFSSLDEPAQLFPITPARAVEFGGSPASVRVGLNISNYSVFDLLNNDFVFAGTIWFEFDPSITSLETVKKFSFEKGEILSISEPTTKIVGDKLLASYDIRIKKKDNLNHSFFPFNSHRLHVVVDNRATPGELVFDSSVVDLVIACGAVPTGWRIDDARVETGYAISQLESYALVESCDEEKKSSQLPQQITGEEQTLYHPRVIFEIDFARNSTRQLMTILLPLIIIFFINLFAFSMDPVAYYRSILTLSTGAVTALLAYRFVIENLSPKVSYFMLSDYLFFLFLGACCVLFLINTRTLELSGRAKAMYTILIHAAVLLIMIYLFKWWM